jgi:phage terminase large subunit-like protein
MAPTTEDIQGTQLEGESGLMNVIEPDLIAYYNRSRLEIGFTNGAKLRTFPMCEPERLRGPQSDLIWVEEPTAVAPGDLAVSAWNNAMFGFRLGERPRCVVSYTPKARPIYTILRALKNAVVSRGTSYDNFDNLSPAMRDVIGVYEGTRLGAQELQAIVLEDVPGALWKTENIERYAFRDLHEPKVDPDTGYRDPERVLVHKEQVNHRALCRSLILKRVIAIDPTVRDPAMRRMPDKDPDACGMVVVSCGFQQRDPVPDKKGDDTRRMHFYVEQDMTAVMSPSTWAKLCDRSWKWLTAKGSTVNEVIYEGNQGGDLVRKALQAENPQMPIREVWASKASRPDAESVSLLYEQGRVHHVGWFPDLEGHMTTWNALNPAEHCPDDVSALVWAFHALGMGMPVENRVTTISRERRHYEEPSGAWA